MSYLTHKPLNRQQYLQYFGRFKKLSEKPGARISGLISLTIFTVAFFALFALLPTFKTIASLNRQIEDAKLVNGKLAQKIAALNNVEGEYLRLAPDLTVVETVLPSEVAFERLAWQINWLTNNLGLTLVSGSFGEWFITQNPEQNEEVVGLPIELAVSGSYAQIKTFVDQVVTIDRLITVDELNISNKGVSLDNQSLTANLRLTAYYLPQTQ